MAQTRPRRSSNRNQSALTQSTAQASVAVRRAANALERELASSLAGVRRLESRFSDTRRVDAAAFDQVLQRFRSNAHEFIDMASHRVTDLRSDDVQDLSRRMTADAHELFDTMISLVGMAPEVINRLSARADKEMPPVEKRARSNAPRRQARTQKRS